MSSAQKGIIEITFKDFEDLFKANYSSLCRIAWRITNSQEAAEDIVQDCFYRLWKEREKIAIRFSIKSYLYKTVANAALNHIKSNKRFQVLELKDDGDFIDDSDNKESEEQKDAMAAKIKSVVDELPPKCRAVFVLCKYEGMKYREVAETLEISIKTVENQMLIAMQKIRENLGSKIVLLIMLCSFIN
jgi:RNA polymerase sigma-70 factor (ECF subfamily)